MLNVQLIRKSTINHLSLSIIIIVIWRMQSINSDDARQYDRGNEQLRKLQSDALGGFHFNRIALDRSNCATSHKQKAAQKISTAPIPSLEGNFAWTNQVKASHLSQVDSQSTAITAYLTPHHTTYLKISRTDLNVLCSTATSFQASISKEKHFRW